MKEKPNKIYKYVALDTLNVILKEQTLKFAAPAEFNDPFDCDIDLVDFDFSGEISPIVAREVEIIKNEFRDSEEFNVNKNKTSFWQDLYKGSQLFKVNSFRISCFSLANNITLMWSHYAKKHTGACLEFDNLAEKRFINLTEEEISEGQVGYESYTRINYISEDRLYAFYKLFLSKGESWSHEKEHRIILINNKPELQKFYPKFLLAIYFGLRVTENQIDSFIERFSIPEFSHLKYYRATKSNLSIKFLQIETKSSKCKK